MPLNPLQLSLLPEGFRVCKYITSKSTAAAIKRPVRSVVCLPFIQLLVRCYSSSYFLHYCTIQFSVCGESYLNNLYKLVESQK